MIISASRRTDIPAFFFEWFANRLKAGFAYVRNPMNFHQVSKIRLSQDVVDGIVLWTKNPIPAMERLGELGGYNYYFQFTLTPYGRNVEPGLPPKGEELVPAFQRLSRAVGRERVVWRYDPIFLNSRYTAEYHCEQFEELSSRLCDYTEKCTVSFIDMYKNAERNMRPLGIRPMSYAQIDELMQRFSEIAKSRGIGLDTCSEAVSLERYGIAHASCIDRERLERIGGCRLSLGKDPGQRKECGCASSIDIGAYNTCRNGCLYCYATFSHDAARAGAKRHDPRSPLLVGEIGEGDVVREREAISSRDGQMSLFDNFAMQK